MTKTAGSDDRAQIFALVEKGRHIDAMKLLMEIQGIGILRAKSWVEGFMHGVFAEREASEETTVQLDPDRLAEIMKRFAPRTGANANSPKGKFLSDLHKEWLKDPEYRQAYEAEARTPFSPREAEASHARAKKHVEKAIRSQKVKVALKKQKAKAKAAVAKLKAKRNGR